MTISELENKYIKIGRTSITVINTETDKTCGVVRNICKFFEIVEPKHDLKKYLICANMFRDGGIIAEAETEAEAENKLHCIYNQVNEK